MLGSKRVLNPVGTAVLHKAAPGAASSYYRSNPLLVPSKPRNHLLERDRIRGRAAGVAGIAERVTQIP